jgi:hypothetical protein
MKHENCNLHRAAEICQTEFTEASQVPKVLPSKPPKVFAATDALVNSYCAALRTNEEAQLFLTKRGITMVVAERLKFGFAKRFGRSYLSIPRYWKGQLVGLKYRAIDVGMDASSEYKWAQEEASAGDFIYLADADPIDASSNSVSVVEGELDTALMLSMGFNAVGVIATAGVPQLGKEGERFKESIALLKSRYDHINLIGDQGPSERTKGVQAMHRMNAFIGRGACFLALPEDQGQEIQPRRRKYPPYKDVSAALDINAFGDELKTYLRRAIELNQLCSPVPRHEGSDKLVKIFSKAEQYAYTKNPKDLATAVIRQITPFTANENTDDLKIPAFPEQVLQGRFGEIVDIITGGTTLPKQFAYQIIKTWAGIYGSGKLALSDMDVLTHYYTILIAQKGSGKGETFKRLRQCLEVSESHALGPEDVDIWDSADSDVGIKESFQEHSRALFWVDEMSDLLAKARADRNPGILTTLLTLANSTTLGRRLKGNHTKIQNCRLAAVMGIQPQIISTAFAGIQGVTLGFYDRLYLEYADKPNVKDTIKP